MLVNEVRCMHAVQRATRGQCCWYCVFLCC